MNLIALEEHGKDRMIMTKDDYSGVNETLPVKWKTRPQSQA